MLTFIIIGAGVSGLASAAHCLKYGYSIIILEKESDIGGVWYSKSYPDIQLQSTKHSYAFSDFPHSNKTTLYPTRLELIHYFKNYCKKHNISKYIQFNSKVIHTYFNNNTNLWEIQYINNNNKYKRTSNYLIVASGFYTDKIIPNIHNTYSNKIIYPENFSYSGTLKNSYFKNKHIVIIGNGPTGCDLAVSAINNNAKSCTILYRTNRWIFRRYLWNYISTDFLLSRLSLNLANLIPTIIYIITIIITYYLIYIWGHGYFGVNVSPPFSTVNRTNLVLNESIINYIYNNKIQYIKTSTITINKHYIKTLHNILPYDSCILATGYKNDIKFMGMKTIPYLYKKIIHPNIKNCGFIGFAASFNWIQISELQIQWYLNYINKKIHISKNIMNKEIQDNYNNKYDYHDLSIIAYKYCDSLAHDININIKYPIYNPKYWLISPTYDYWSVNNK